MYYLKWLVLAVSIALSACSCELDIVLGGGRVERLPIDSPEKRKLLELAVRKAVYENTSIPPERKESTIRTSLRESMNPEPSCTHELEYYLGRFEDRDGGDFSPQSLPGGKSVFIEFYADWCLPCKQQERALEHYFPKRGNEFVLLKVERDKTRFQSL